MKPVSAMNSTTATATPPTTVHTTHGRNNRLCAPTNPEAYGTKPHPTPGSNQPEPTTPPDVSKGTFLSFRTGRCEQGNLPAAGDRKVPLLRSGGGGDG
ncbi:hypothetical protein GCM10011581_07340 [Saccharopolyspora subtropica]|uniref:Uncharacterized protein n=1 Tax=Saccharopolyspora thermophila TaxID=89367 RepID=A0A917JMH0_9PSEU|nr:hypothetical protein GCM10011581_07340 [Saccharopolyspora subtropica]